MIRFGHRQQSSSAGTSYFKIPALRRRAARRQHRAELEKIVRTWASGKTRQEIWDGLRELDYFGAPVLSIGEVMEDQHIKERRAFIERDHPAAGPDYIACSLDSPL